LSKSLFYSIVIPSRNRSDLLLEAVKTVLRQEYASFEVCVFDNCSDEPLEPLLASLNDERIRIQRSDKPLHVTESWNSALEMARGDYVTLIGNDDGLLPKFFERTNDLIDRFGEPDVVFCNLYQLIYPGVSPSEPLGFTNILTMADFLIGAEEPFLLDKKTAEQSAQNSLEMRRSFLFQMPAFTCKRSFLNGIRGKEGDILRSPYPDYYFANLAIAKSKRTLCVPQPLAFQGVAYGSFGFALFNQKVDEDFTYLGTAQADDISRSTSSNIISGARYNSDYIVTMAYLADTLGGELKPDFGRYRKMQIAFNARRQIPTIGNLSNSEKLFDLKCRVLKRVFRPAYKKILSSLNQYSVDLPSKRVRTGEIMNGRELFDAFDKGEIPSVA
jgi:hypothetical protein